MKKRFLRPIAVITLGAFSMYGCASSNDNTGATAMESTTMSETNTMAGNATTTDEGTLDALIIEETVVVPVATLSVTALAMENTVEVDDMFEAIEETENYDVLALARTSPNLSTFVKLLEQANLVDDLERVEELTLFAPTNEAFAKLPAEKLETLLKPGNEALLSRMLQAHVLSSEVSSVQLEDNTRIRVSEESYIPIETDMAGTVTTVGGAQIIKDDIEASNGVLHVVDAVIMPSEDIQEEDSLN